MNAEIKGKIKEHALRESPNEACGFVCVNHLGEVIVMPCENTAHNKRGRFVIDPKKNIEAAKAGHIVAFYHSHAGEFLDEASDRFSKEDLDMAYEACLPAILYVHPHDKWHYNQPDTYKPISLLGRPFVWGVWDCYTIVKDYFKLTKGITMGTYFPPDDATLQSDFGYETLIKNEKFNEVSIEEIQKDDVLLMKVNSEHINHCLIYLGNNEFLHQPANKISSKGILDGRRLKYVVKALRYAN